MTTQSIVFVIVGSILGLLAGVGAHAADSGVHYEVLLDRPLAQTVTDDERNERRLGQPGPEEPEAKVAAVLDDWHAAAAAADRERYVGHLADETVFMGTDATERWDREAFVDYLTPHFERGDGWTFEPRQRRVTVADDGRTAWFDELLDSATYGELRGSGVLIREGKAWKIAQYNLSIPLPNELARDIVEQISAHHARPGADE